MKQCVINGLKLVLNFIFYAEIKERIMCTSTYLCMPFNSFTGESCLIKIKFLVLYETDVDRL